MDDAGIMERVRDEVRALDERDRVEIEAAWHMVLDEGEGSADELPIPKERGQGLHFSYIRIVTPNPM